MDGFSVNQSTIGAMKKLCKNRNIKEITTYERSSRVRKGKNNSQRILKNS